MKLQASHHILPQRAYKNLNQIYFGQYWYYAIKAEQIKKKMDQATKAFHERDEYYRDSKLYDSFYAEYTKHVERFHQQLKTVDEILSK